MGTTASLQQWKILEGIIARARRKEPLLSSGPSVEQGRRFRTILLVQKAENMAEQEPDAPTDEVF